MSMSGGAERGTGTERLFDMLGLGKAAVQTRVASTKDGLCSLHPALHLCLTHCVTYSKAHASASTHVFPHTAALIAQKLSCIAQCSMFNSTEPLHKYQLLDGCPANTLESQLHCPQFRACSQRQSPYRCFIYSNLYVQCSNSSVLGARAEPPKRDKHMLSYNCAAKNRCLNATHFPGVADCEVMRKQDPRVPKRERAGYVMLSTTKDPQWLRPVVEVLAILPLTASCKDPPQHSNSKGHAPCRKHAALWFLDAAQPQVAAVAVLWRHSHRWQAAQVAWRAFQGPGVRQAS